MKKILSIITAVAFASMAQAAVLNWGSSTLDDNGGALDDGGGYALAGVDMYLIYNGINGATAFDSGSFAYDMNTSALTVNFGSAVGTIVDSYTTVANDYNVLGGFNAVISGITQTWLGDTSATWEDMNLRQFTIVSISDANDDYSTGATWNFYTANVSGFSTGSGAGSIAGLNTGTFQASGQGALNVIAVPEPATFLLFGIGGMGAFIVRRNKRKTQEEADA